MGIKRENLDKLFMNFAKLDEHSKMNAQGTGLGLSICKQIIEKMGGSVSVDSIEGVGTTFTIELLIKALVVDEQSDVEKLSSSGSDKIIPVYRNSVDNSLIE